MTFASSAYASANNLMLGNVYPERSCTTRIAAFGPHPVTYVKPPDEAFSIRSLGCPAHLNLLRNSRSDLNPDLILQIVLMPCELHMLPSK